MSYISGFMMGAAIGKGLRQFLGGGAPVPARKPSPAAFCLAAKSAGRRRYRAAMVSPALAGLLTKEIGKLPFVKTVEVNHATGSLLLTFDEKDAGKIDVLAGELKRRIFCAGSAVPKKIAPCPAEHAEQGDAGSITVSVRNTMADFSAFIKRITGGVFDAKSLAAMLLLLRGLRKMILTKQYPSGSAMLWWAVSLMRGWRAI